MSLIGGLRLLGTSSPSCGYQSRRMSRDGGGFSELLDGMQALSGHIWPVSVLFDCGPSGAVPRQGLGQLNKIPRSRRRAGGRHTTWYVTRLSVNVPIVISSAASCQSMNSVDQRSFSCVSIDPCPRANSAA